MRPSRIALVALIFLSFYVLAVYEVYQALHIFCNHDVLGACRLARTVFTLTALGLMAAFTASLLVLVFEARLVQQK